MRIKISNKNEAALNEAINAANGRATAHTLNRSTLLQWVASAEQRLAELGIPKCARRGAVARRMSGGSVPSAYKYPRTRTTATVERGGSAWYLTEIAASETFDKRAGELCITLNAALTERHIAFLRAGGVTLTQPEASEVAK